MATIERNARRHDRNETYVSSLHSLEKSRRSLVLVRMISERQLPIPLFDCPLIRGGVYAESQVWVLRKPAHRCSQDLCGPDGETIEVIEAKRG